jgi:hypothetical protein
MADSKAEKDVEADSEHARLISAPSVATAPTPPSRRAGGGKKKEDGVWDQYEGQIKEFLVLLQPHVLVALILTTIFVAAWSAIYGWGIHIYASGPVACGKPLQSWLATEGVIGIICGALLVLVFALAYTILDKNVLGEAPNPLPVHYTAIVTSYLILVRTPRSLSPLPAPYRPDSPPFPVSPCTARLS